MGKVVFGRLPNCTVRQPHDSANCSDNSSENRPQRALLFGTRAVKVALSQARGYGLLAAMRLSKSACLVGSIAIKLKLYANDQSHDDRGTVQQFNTLCFQLQPVA